jgi:hypothetical protein
MFGDNPVGKSWLFECTDIEFFLGNVHCRPTNERVSYDLSLND